MRKAYSEVTVIGEDSKIQGLCLGYDHCSEHEWGIKGIRRKLEQNDRVYNKTLGIVTKSVLGAETRMVHNYENIVLGKFDYWHRKGTQISHEKKNGYKKKIAFFLETKGISIYADDQESALREGRCNMLSYYELEREEPPEGFLWSEWDENNLRAVFTNEDIFDALKDVIKSKNLLVGLGGSLNPFAGAGLYILDFRAYSEDDVKEMAQADLNHINMLEYARLTMIEKRLKKAGKSWFALSPKKLNKEDMKKHKTKFSVIFWLNPTEQRIVNYGWFTVEELRMWIKGKGPIVKQDEVA